MNHFKTCKHSYATLDLIWPVFSRNAVRVCVHLVNVSLYVFSKHQWNLPRSEIWGFHASSCARKCNWWDNGHGSILGKLKNWISIILKKNLKCHEKIFVSNNLIKKPANFIKFPSFSTWKTINKYPIYSRKFL